MAPARTLALDGETFTVTPEPPEFELEAAGPFVVPAHPASIEIANDAATK